MNTLITLENAALSIGSRSLLKGMNVSIHSGELCMLLGPNGAGKSSLLGVLAGDLALTQGARLTPAWAQSSPAWLARHRAVLPQQSNLNFDFSAEEVVALSRTPHASGARRDQAIVHDALAAMDMAHLAGAAYTRLSGGERQRVQLARVLAQVWEAVDDAPRLLLLDEPTAALDLAHQRQLMRVLGQLVAAADGGLGVVAVIHDLNLAAAYAQRVICLSNGEVAADGSPDQVLNAALVGEVFSCEVRVMSHPDTGRPVLVYAN